MTEEAAKTVERVIFQDPSTIQTLIFLKEKFPQQSDATSWARDHDFRADKVDESENSFRLRQKKPEDFVEGSMRTIDITDGVKGVIGRLKKSLSKGELEWEEKRNEFPFPKQPERFVVTLREGGGHVLRLGLPSDSGEHFIFKLDNFGHDLEAIAKASGMGPFWWLDENHRKDTNPVDDGSWVLISRRNGTYRFGFLGKVLKGEYTLAKNDRGYWVLSGPYHDPYVVITKQKEKQYTLGVAYPARQEDSHGDAIEAEDLEKAAWQYMAKRSVGIMHKNGTDGAGNVVESYIYRGPTWTENGQTIRKGDWLLGVIWNDETWAQIRKNRYTGFSIQGWAVKDGEE